MGTPLHLTVQILKSVAASSGGIVPGGGSAERGSVSDGAEGGGAHDLTPNDWETKVPI